MRTLEQVRRSLAILEVRTAAPDAAGLLSAIRRCAARHLVKRGISVRCEFQDEFETHDRRFPAAFEDGVFRACEAAMSDIALHAEAEVVIIRVSESGGVLRIAIQLDGGGFDPDRARGGHGPAGLAGIREAVELLGGSVRIDSVAATATTVHIDVPLPPDGEGDAPVPRR